MKIDRLNWHLELPELVLQPTFLRLRVADEQRVREGPFKLVAVAWNVARVEDGLHLWQGAEGESKSYIMNSVLCNYQYGFILECYNGHMVYEHV